MRVALVDRSSALGCQPLSESAREFEIPSGSVPIPTPLFRLGVPTPTVANREALLEEIADLDLHARWNGSFAARPLPRPVHEAQKGGAYLALPRASYVFPFTPTAATSALLRLYVGAGEGARPSTFSLGRTEERLGQVWAS